MIPLDGGLGGGHGVAGHSPRDVLGGGGDRAAYNLAERRKCKWTDDEVACLKAIVTAQQKANEVGTYCLVLQLQLPATPTDRCVIAAFDCFANG
eukprot:SAG22_NODE_687_length_7913_cov_2.611851_3_plen_94_part_00